VTEIERDVVGAEETGHGDRGGGVLGDLDLVANAQNGFGGPPVRRAFSTVPIWTPAMRTSLPALSSFREEKAAVTV